MSKPSLKEWYAYKGRADGTRALSEPAGVGESVKNIGLLMGSFPLRIIENFFMMKTTFHIACPLGSEM
jgi:hypothetical protein